MASEENCSRYKKKSIVSNAAEISGNDHWKLTFESGNIKRVMT